MKRKQPKQRRRKNRRLRPSPPRRTNQGQWPIGAGMQFVLSTTGEPADGLHDDCPICRELRAAGEPVFTIDALGQLTLVPSGPEDDAMS